VVNVELRHLRSFLVLAEELNFTRAAAKLNIVQQALSAQMRQLEEELGAELFVRTTRKVELTAVGRGLMAHASAVLRTVESVFDQVRESTRGESGNLNVGMVATAPLEFTPRLFRAFSEMRPKVTVSIHSAPFSDPSGGVRSGLTDVALVWRPFDERGLACEPLFTDERVALLPVDHPLSEQPVVDADELALEPFVWVDEMDQTARDFWTLAEARAGKPPRIGATITGFEDLFTAVRAGRAVAAAPRSIATVLPFPDLTTRPVRGLAPAVVAACWRDGDRNPLIAAFVQCARQATDSS
jgi:DNA-binding transcriptional LysR family regulator